MNQKLLFRDACHEEPPTPCSKRTEFFRDGVGDSGGCNPTSDPPEEPFSTLQRHVHTTLSGPSAEEDVHLRFEAGDKKCKQTIKNMFLRSRVWGGLVVKT